MRKLHKLKKWYSVNEAVERLSITLGEKVTHYDLVDFIVEEHLPIFWNIRYRYGIPVSLQTREFDDSKIKNLFGEDEEDDVKPSKVIMTGYYATQDDVERLEGVFKLETKICGAVEDHIKTFATGIPSELTTIDGFFVSDEDGKLYRLEDRYPSEYLKDIKNKTSHFYDGTNFHPSADFPDYRELGFTKDSLEKFEQLLLENETNTHDNFSNREKETYQNTIGALLGLLLGRSPTGKPYSSFNSQQSIIDAIHGNYGDRHGLSKRNLESKFAEAKRTLKSNYPDSE